MSIAVKTMDQLALAGRRLLIREDLNVPISDGAVASDARIRAALPTLRKALDAGARVLVLSHLGRPTEGRPEAKYSLAPVAERLAELLGREVPLVENWLDGVELDDGEIALCENVRFLEGEKANDEALARRMASLCDVFVMDAFGSAHRAHASTEGVARYAPVACAGPLLAGELEALAAALSNPKRPLVAIVGGSKVSTKLSVLESLAALADTLIVGGGIANTLLAAAGKPVGASLHEPDQMEFSRALLNGDFGPAQIPLPSDVAVAKAFSADAPSRTTGVEDVAEDEMILDVGPRTAAGYGDLMAAAGTIVWNGPVGVFEFPAFAAGTEALAKAVASSTGFSIAGGGDTLAAVEQFGIAADVSYISTGGGAFLEFLEGKVLPAVAALEARARD